ncbi:hypothetical protein F53441_10675 [Fusarium austroafricanum]|uniref:F-box domain-containing protein n=1 Tax=Fusarium austroafricanum TaxID=2364996 RepID=A0A8H4K924_9HYPO|nr:hypothetical protein F53441_10675 [Fusarium austroafricanum]
MPSALVPEIWDNICSYLTPPSLGNLRLASRRFNELALPWKYRSIRLEGFGPSVERFIQIAKDPKLRSLVREMTIDTRIHMDFQYSCNESYEVNMAFMNALPYLRYFPNIMALHIRFEEHCGDVDRMDWSTEIEESYAFRYKVLDTILHCAAGLWTLEKQLKIDKVMEGFIYLDEGDEFDYSDQDLDFVTDTPFQLKELTITHLADYDDDNITSSEAWKKVISLPTLVDLKLFVTTEEEEASPESAVYFQEKYMFFENLHNTWLSPNLADNLKVLSLYFRDYWGWIPQMDFRDIGEDAPFPQLKVLALGNYVFSHEWQIGWFSKVGLKNGSGGLEELYLDDCPILYKARQNGMQEDGYPDWEVVSGREYNPGIIMFPLRWHEILSAWKDTMKGLKVFRQGHGSWWSAPEDTMETIMRDPEYEDMDRGVLEYRLCHEHYRNFNLPRSTGDDDDNDDREKAWTSGRYRHGTGPEDRERVSRMQYIEYDIGTGPSPWLETAERYRYGRDQESFELEEGTVAKDDAAWDMFMAAVKLHPKRINLPKTSTLLLSPPSTNIKMSSSTKAPSRSDMILAMSDPYLQQITKAYEFRKRNMAGIKGIGPTALLLTPPSRTSALSTKP